MPYSLLGIEESEVFEILGPAGGPLVPDELSQADVNQRYGGSFGTDLSDRSSWPCLSKINTVNSIEEINPVRRQTELHDQTFPFQLEDIPDPRDVSLPEFVQRSIETLNVLFRLLVKEINISGQSHMSIENNRFTPNHHVVHFMFMQKSNKFQDIWGKEGGL